MGFMLLMPDTDNLLSEAVLTASSEDANYPATNVALLPISRVWHSAGIVSEYILLDFGSPAGIDFVALINHNLTSDVEVVIKAGATSACADFTASAVIWRSRDIFKQLVTTQTHRWWKILFGDEGNPDGFISVGYLQIGMKTVLSFGFNYGWSMARRYENLEQETEFGVKRIAPLYDKMRVKLKFENLLTNEVDELLGIIAALRRSVYPTLLAPDSGVYDGWFGRIVSDEEVIVTSHSRRSLALQFEEDSRGRIIGA